jgi:hypothetical protein
MKPCTKCGKHEAPANHRHCTPCRSAYLKDYRDRVGASVKGPYPWQPDPLNAVFVNWLQVRA